MSDDACKVVVEMSAGRPSYVVASRFQSFAVVESFAAAVAVGHPFAKAGAVVAHKSDAADGLDYVCRGGATFADA